MEGQILAFLSGLANGGAPIEFVKGAYIPFTETIVHAIDALGPQLTCLHIRWSSPEEPEQPLEATSSLTGAFELLMQLVGPRLKDFNLAPLIGGPSPVCSLDALTCCTALTRLELCNDMYNLIDQVNAPSEETSMLRTLSTLTSLRDLSLSGGATPPINAVARAERAAHMEACLSPLTALTRLDIRLCCLLHEHDPSMMHWVPHPDVEKTITRLEENGLPEEVEQLRAAVRAEWRALATAAKRMPRLAVLRTYVHADVSDLAALTALTYLRVGALVSPTPTASAAVPAAVRSPTLYYLPPRLKRLVAFAPLPVQLAQMLRHETPATEPSSTGGGNEAGRAVTLPSDVISWEAPRMMLYGDQPYWILGFTSDEVDEEERLTPLAAAAARNAAVSLQQVFRFKQPTQSRGNWHVGPHLSLGPKSGRLMPPVEPDGTHCGSWLGTVVSELRPLSVWLRGLFLSAREMMAMSRCLDGVKVLALHNACYSVSSLPLLGDLVNLEKLWLRAQDWTWPDESDQDHETEVLQAAFLGLAMPSRRLLSCQPGRTAAGEVVATEDDLYRCPAALPLPRLRQLRVACDSAEWGESLRTGLEPAEVEFDKRPNGVAVHVDISVAE